MLSDRCLVLSVLSVTLGYCGQTVGWIKMKLGKQIGLGPGHFVLDGGPAPSPPKGHSPIFGPCLLWPTAGWIKMPLGREVGLGPGNIVLDGDPAPFPRRGTAPHFGSMSIVAKRSPISATAEHWYILSILYAFSVTLWLGLGLWLGYKIKHQ